VSGILARSAFLSVVEPITNISKFGNIDATPKMPNSAKRLLGVSISLGSNSKKRLLLAILL
jgi:hypothetical protein